VYNLAKIGWSMCCATWWCVSYHLTPRRLLLDHVFLLLRTFTLLPPQCLFAPTSVSLCSHISVSWLLMKSTMPKLQLQHYPATNLLTLPHELISRIMSQTRPFALQNISTSCCPASASLRPSKYLTMATAVNPLFHSFKITGITCKASNVLKL
jgi:hypothetical protein